MINITPEKDSDKKIRGASYRTTKPIGSLHTFGEIKTIKRHQKREDRKASALIIKKK
jgi:hypothetical protein